MYMKLFFTWSETSFLSENWKCQLHKSIYSKQEKRNYMQSIFPANPQVSSGQETRNSCPTHMVDPSLLKE